jgi:uncharacterized protein (DUF2147 family)
MRNIIIAVLILTFGPVAAMAQTAGTPVGKWKTIDDETNAPRSIVEITDVNGELQGRILQIFYRPDEKPDPVCEACEGERKDKPVIGMTFLWGLKPDGSNEWASGSVLDPKNGKIYNAKATLTEAGQKLRLRGFIGTPILGRTQIWLREP